MILGTSAKSHPSERFHHAGKILRGGRAHAHAFQVRCAVAQRVVVAFAARLLEHVARLSAGRRLELALLADAGISSGMLAASSLTMAIDLVHFRTTHLDAGEAVAAGRRDGREIAQLAIGAMAQNAAIVPAHCSHGQTDRPCTARKPAAGSGSQPRPNGCAPRNPSGRSHRFPYIRPRWNRACHKSNEACRHQYRARLRRFARTTESRGRPWWPRKYRARARANAEQCVDRVSGTRQASAARPSHKRCECTRDSSCRITRRYCARPGTSTPMSDSTVSA